MAKRRAMSAAAIKKKIAKHLSEAKKLTTKLEAAAKKKATKKKSKKKRASKKRASKKRKKKTPSISGPAGTIRKIKGRYYKKGKGGVVRPIKAATAKKARKKKSKRKAKKKSSRRRR